MASGESLVPHDGADGLAELRGIVAESLGSAIQRSFQEQLTYVDDVAICWPFVAEARADFVARSEVSALAQSGEIAPPEHIKRVAGLILTTDNPAIRQLKLTTIASGMYDRESKGDGPRSKSPTAVALESLFAYANLDPPGPDLTLLQRIASVQEDPSMPQFMQEGVHVSGAIIPFLEMLPSDADMEAVCFITLARIIHGIKTLPGVQEWSDAKILLETSHLLDVILLDYSEVNLHVAYTRLIGRDSPDRDAAPVNLRDLDDFSYYAERWPQLQLITRQARILYDVIGVSEICRNVIVTFEPNSLWRTNLVHWVGNVMVDVASDQMRRTKDWLGQITDGLDFDDPGIPPLLAAEAQVVDACRAKVAAVAEAGLLTDVAQGELDRIIRPHIAQRIADRKQHKQGNAQETSILLATRRRDALEASLISTGYIPQDLGDIQTDLSWRLESDYWEEEVETMQALAGIVMRFCMQPVTELDEFWRWLKDTRTRIEAQVERLQELGDTSGSVVLRALAFVDTLIDQSADIPIAIESLEEFAEAYFVAMNE